MSLSLVLPLNISSMGFESYPDSETLAAINQNLRMLLLTAPGEYVMDADFGVGLNHYLFEQGTGFVDDVIKAEIRKQCAIYLPYIVLNSVDMNYADIDSNVLGIKINYSVSKSILNEVLEMTINL